MAPPHDAVSPSPETWRALKPLLGIAPVTAEAGASGIDADVPGRAALFAAVAGDGISTVNRQPTLIRHLQSTSLCQP